MTQKHIICPYCLHTFHPNTAVFEVDCGSLYCTAESPGVDYDDEEKNKNGFVETITYRSKEDSTGKEITKRCCPACYVELYNGAGRRMQFFFCIIGGPSAGKSAYFSHLIHSLTADTHNYGQAHHIGSSNEITYFNDTYTKPMFEAGKSPVRHSGSSVSYLPVPYIFKYMPAHVSADINEDVFGGVDVVFYDIPGDVFFVHERIESLNKLLECCSGLFWIMDAASFLYNRPYAQMLYPGSVFTMERAMPSSDYIVRWRTVLESFNNNRPVAFVLQKLDLLFHEKYYPFNCYDLSTLRRNPSDDTYDETTHTCERIPYIKKWLELTKSDETINSLSMIFPNNQIFLSSALGGQVPFSNEVPAYFSTPEYGHPFGERAPFEWMILKQKMF